MKIGCEDHAAINFLPLPTISMNRNPKLEIQKLPCFITRYWVNSTFSLSMRGSTFISREVRVVQGKFGVVCMTTLKKKATEACTAHSSKYFEFLLSDAPNFAEWFAANPQILALVWITPPTNYLEKKYPRSGVSPAVIPGSKHKPDIVSWQAIHDASCCNVKEETFFHVYHPLLNLLKEMPSFEFAGQREAVQSFQSLGSPDILGKLVTSPLEKNRSEAFKINLLPKNIFPQVLGVQRIPSCPLIKNYFHSLCEVHHWWLEANPLMASPPRPPGAQVLLV